MSRDAPRPPTTIPVSRSFQGFSGGERNKIANCSRYKLENSVPLNPRICEAPEKLSHLLLTGERNKPPQPGIVLLLRRLRASSARDDISLGHKNIRFTSMNNQFMYYHKRNCCSPIYMSDGFFLRSDPFC